MRRSRIIRSSGSHCGMGYWLFDSIHGISSGRRRTKFGAGNEFDAPVVLERLLEYCAN